MTAWTGFSQTLYIEHVYAYEILIISIYISLYRSSTSRPMRNNAFILKGNSWTGCTPPPRPDHVHPVHARLGPLAARSVAIRLRPRRLGLALGAT